MSEKLLIGHTSPETAYVQPDYPYGRELRCKRRVWIESKPSKGQRFVYQTSNPKRDGEVWNKPHAGTYSTVAVMYLDTETDHINVAGLSLYGYRDTLEAFIERFGETALMADDWIAKALPFMRKVAPVRVVKLVEQSAVTCIDCGKPVAHDRGPVRCQPCDDVRSKR